MSVGNCFSTLKTVNVNKEHKSTWNKISYTFEIYKIIYYLLASKASSQPPAMGRERKTRRGLI